jgi:hypothetical protein
MDPHTLEEKTSKPTTRFQQFPRKNSVTYSEGTINAFGQKGKIFTICCSTGVLY